MGIEAELAAIKRWSAVVGLSGCVAMVGFALYLAGIGGPAMAGPVFGDRVLTGVGGILLFLPAPVLVLGLGFKAWFPRAHLVFWLFAMLWCAPWVLYGGTRVLVAMVDGSLVP